MAGVLELCACVGGLIDRMIAIPVAGGHWDRSQQMVDVGSPGPSSAARTRYCHLRLAGGPDQATAGYLRTADGAGDGSAGRPHRRPADRHSSHREARPRPRRASRGYQHTCRSSMCLVGQARLRRSPPSAQAASLGAPQDSSRCTSRYRPSVSRCCHPLQPRPQAVDELIGDARKPGSLLGLASIVPRQRRANSKRQGRHLARSPFD